ncbi:MAG TPA: hypothetical protein PKW95_02570 [bacterium]|nr:hypothetical protein [bacterium]
MSTKVVKGTFDIGIRGINGPQTTGTIVNDSCFDSLPGDSETNLKIEYDKWLELKEKKGVFKELAKTQIKKNATAKKQDGFERFLRWHVCLMGETNPFLSPLSPDIVNDEDYKIYRYDWCFGITCISDHFWDWQAALRSGSSIAFHLILSCDEDVGFTTVAADLHSLHPSRNTKSVFERISPYLLKGLSTASTAGESLYPGLKQSTKALSMLTNFIESEQGDEKNWFLYNILDERRNSHAIEWRIDTKVLRQFGPLLRGSIVLAFHGNQNLDQNGKPTRRIRITARPQLGFLEHDEISFIWPTEYLPEGKQIAIDVKPVPAEKSLG